MAMMMIYRIMIMSVIIAVTIAILTILVITLCLSLRMAYSAPSPRHSTTASYMLRRAGKDKAPLPTCTFGFRILGFCAVGVHASRPQHCQRNGSSASGQQP